jgi:CheY-like chemotaxis protein
MRILAIDDEPDVRDMLQILLEDHGASVLTAASAQEGLEALSAWKPHVLISDIGMPEEDGYSLIRKIRALSPEQGADVPAIALTGYVRVEERIRALEAGYQMFVPKPVETNELLSIIGDLFTANN